MRLSLHSFSLPKATLGWLAFPSPLMGHAGLWTVERPWKDNAPFYSCVPGGFYSLVPYSSEKYPDTWALLGEHVSVRKQDGVARYTCLFHIANWALDVEGCIGPGLGTSSSMKNPKTGKVEPAVSSSSSAMDVLRQLLIDEEEQKSIAIYRDFEAARWATQQT